jgi:hypothetical protein
MSPKRYLMIRGVALVLLLMVVYIAWTRNFGEGIKSVPALAVVTAAFSFALDWIDRSQAERLKKWLTHSLLSLPFLVTGYIVAFIVLSSWAPVILLNSGSNPLKATLTAADMANPQEKSATAEKNAPARFHVWTTPLGRPFRLKAKGYATKSLDVAAPVGVSVDAERDLTPQLVVLIRPTLDGMRELLSGGSVHVFRNGQATEDEIACSVSKTESSVLVGPALVPIPNNMVEDWRLELAGANQHDVTRAEVLRAWKTPVRAKFDRSAEEVQPHQVLRVELRNSGEEPVQCGSMELPETAETIVDFPLTPCKNTAVASIPKKAKCEYEK